MRFSIITCTLNSAKYLSENIKSVEEQTFSDFEHIFVDGGSTDETKKIVNGYQKKYPNKVTLLTSEPRGIANAMNVGVKKSRGQYIMHLHSDDYLYDKEVLEDVDSFIESHRPDWIYGKEQQVDRLGKPMKINYDNPLLHVDSASLAGSYLLKFFCFVRHQTVFINREVFRRFGVFDENILVPMDHEYWLRIRKETNWKFFNRTIDHFRFHEESLSSMAGHQLKNLTERAKIQKKYMNWFEFYCLKPIIDIAIVIRMAIQRELVIYRSILKKQ